MTIEVITVTIPRVVLGLIFATAAIPALCSSQTAVPK
jgi:hypothetical protein